MKIAGIICEYNPFHMGHARQIELTRRRGYDKIVCVMSGHVTQRGELAALSKWARARAALLCGADAVFDLPALFAARTADHFAMGGVGTLAGLGIDAISFGCETDDIGVLRALAALRADEPDDMRRAIAEALARGESLARARGAAERLEYKKYLSCARRDNEPRDNCARGDGSRLWYAEHESRAAVECFRHTERISRPCRESIDAVDGESADVTATLRAPNAILGVEYLRAIDALGAGLSVELIKRDTAHDAADFSDGETASARAIRLACARGDFSAAKARVPIAATRQIDEISRAKPVDDMYIYALRNLGADGIALLPDTGEGLSFRAAKAARVASNLDDFVEKVKCKRYTRARIARLATHALIGLTADIALRHPAPEYARLIAARSDAGDLIKELKSRAALPFLRPVELRGNEIFALECRATDAWALTRADADERRAGREFTEKFVKA